MDIILPESLASAWEGTNHPSEGRVVTAQFRSGTDDVATDYDRACDIEEIIALIPVGTGSGVVFRDASLVTWVPGPSGGCLVVALGWGELTDELVMGIVAKTPVEVFGPPSFQFETSDHRLVLLAAADTFGSKFGYGHMSIDLAPGTYRVNTAAHVDGVDRFLLHSFQRV